MTGVAGHHRGSHGRSDLPKQSRWPWRFRWDRSKCPSSRHLKSAHSRRWAPSWAPAFHMAGGGCICAQRPDQNAGILPLASAPTKAGPLPPPWPLRTAMPGRLSVMIPQLPEQCSMPPGWNSGEAASIFIQCTNVFPASQAKICKKRYLKIMRYLQIKFDITENVLTFLMKREYSIS